MLGIWQFQFSSFALLDIHLLMHHFILTSLHGLLTGWLMSQIVTAMQIQKALWHRI